MHFFSSSGAALQSIQGTYIFHHLLQPNQVPLDLEQKNRLQCNLSKFFIDNLYVNIAVFMMRNMMEV